MVHRGYRKSVEDARSRRGNSETPTVDAIKEAQENGWPRFGVEEAGQLAKGGVQRVLDTDAGSGPKTTEESLDTDGVDK